jgi:SAM-dependent methyltransferase
MIKKIKKILKKNLTNPPKYKTVNEIITDFKNAGSVPWSDGYSEFKWQMIENGISSVEILKECNDEKLAKGFGVGIDERVIEYPWLISHIHAGKGRFLDAGSTFNFEVILDNDVMKNKDIYIYTYHPEYNNYSQKKISYVYGDLRELPFKNNYFDQVVCHSTLEHIDMDNSMYGYELGFNADIQRQSYEYLKVIKELERVVIPSGKIFLTFPYGKFENHGFFQQFDEEMVQRIVDTVATDCTVKKCFAKYELNGWRFASQKECDNAMSYNPHTGKGKGDDNAAHSRAICFIEILKNK